MIEITAIICIAILEAINMIVLKVDGAILSSIVGAIVFIATRRYYKLTGQT